MRCRRADDGHQHDCGVRRHRRIDETAVAVAIDGGGRHMTDVAKPVNRRHDGAHAHHRRTEGATISHVADDDVDLAVIEMRGALPVAREHANGKTSRL